MLAYISAVWQCLLLGNSLQLDPGNAGASTEVILSLISAVDAACLAFFRPTTEVVAPGDAHYKSDCERLLSPSECELRELFGNFMVNLFF